MIHPTAIITTSWDDGNVLDFRLAEMLERHGLAATFYIPRSASTGVMSERQVRELSTRFEVGAHTMNHVFLDMASDAVAQQEIANSRNWVEQVTGRSCGVFCPPAGKFRRVHLKQIRAAGFEGMRTVEFFSLDRPRPHDGVLHLPTTLQAHPNGRSAYVRNIVKRGAWRNGLLYLMDGQGDWETIARRMLDRALRRGGVFHLWGHSWEIEAAGQWKQVDRVLQLLGEAARSVPSVTNGELCRRATTPFDGAEASQGRSMPPAVRRRREAPSGAAR